MLKVSIEDEEEGRTIKCSSLIAASMGAHLDNQIPVIKTITEGEYSLQDLMQLLASITVEVYETMKDETGEYIDLNSFMSNIRTIIDESIKTDEVI